MDIQMADVRILPEFKNSPLTEVVLSVQFAPLVNYRGTNSFEVWSLFREEFSQLEEHPPLPQQFETFGRSAQGSVNLEFVRGPMPSRYWFLTDDKSELLQFQPDRFIQNWRKVAAGGRPYPRFESMIARYFDNIETLALYAETSELGPIAPNQCEVTYINQLPARREDGSVVPPEHYFSLFAKAPRFAASDTRTTFRQEIKDDQGESVGRYIIEFADAWNSDGESIYRLTLVGRGAPQSADLNASREFMERMRLGIFDAFIAVTTDEAQKAWGKET